MSINKQPVVCRLQTKIVMSSRKGVSPFTASNINLGAFSLNSDMAKKLTWDQVR